MKVRCVLLVGAMKGRLPIHLCRLNVPFLNCDLSCDLYFGTIILSLPHASCKAIASRHCVVPRHFPIPNPFFGVCSLNSCKPIIRRTAQKGHWVAANTAADFPAGPGLLVYAMRVTDKMTMGC